MKAGRSARKVESRSLQSKVGFTASGVGGPSYATDSLRLGALLGPPLPCVIDRLKRERRIDEKEGTFAIRRLGGLFFRNRSLTGHRNLSTMTFVRIPFVLKIVSWGQMALRKQHEKGTG